MQVLRLFFRKVRWWFKHEYWPETWEVDGLPFVPPRLPCTHRYIQVRHTLTNDIRPDGGRVTIDEVICADCGDLVKDVAIKYDSPTKEE